MCGAGACIFCFILFLWFLFRDGKTELYIVNHATHYKDFSFYFTDVLQKSQKSGENIFREIKCHVVMPESFVQKSRE